MKIIHFGDVHVWRQEILWREAYYPKRWLGPLNLLVRRAKRFPPATRSALFREILNQQPDVVIFTGDFSNFSLPEEFEEAAALFEPLRQQLGDRLFALPGNHDVYTSRSVRLGLLETYLPWVHTAPLSKLKLSEELTLLGINHAEPFLIRSNGRVREPGLRALEAECERAKEKKQTLWLAGHFPYASPVTYPEGADHVLLGAERLAELIRRYEIPLYLHGHQHVRWGFRPPQTPSTLCLNCGSGTMRHDSPEKQAGFISFDTKKDGDVINVTAHTYDETGSWNESPLHVY